ncbi:MAG: HupE/UreJ family protein [Rhodobacteraceae bacterium]|nr:HupE/UreJ family protein [Paracoccaceae bacterium]
MKRILALTLIPTAAFAHPGGHFDQPFLSGLLHPFSGADHLLAMFAVGLWASVTGRRAIWAMPLAFLLGLLTGGALGASGVALPMVEPMILASTLLLGGATALALRPDLAVSLLWVAVFGVAHGFAHGAEGPAQGWVLYALGFVGASASLNAIGLGLGLVLTRRLIRALGGAAAVAGLAMAFA